MPNDPFTSLLEAARAGSEEAWTELLTPVAPKLVGYLRMRGSRDPEATAGDVFIDVARNIGTFDGGRDNFTSWVFVIAHRRLIDSYRREQARPDEVLTEVPPELGMALSAEDEALRLVSAEELAELLDVLTAPQRDVIFLRIIAQLTLEETTTVLNRPLSAVKALQRRGLAALRRQIQQMGVSQ